MGNVIFNESGVESQATNTDSDTCVSVPANPSGAIDAENWANFLSCVNDDCKKFSNLGPVVGPTY